MTTPLTDQTSTKVTIGIQARLNSQRFPRKIMCNLLGKRMLDHVLDAARNVVRYHARYIEYKPVEIDIALLIPDGDPIQAEVDTTGIHLVTGPEQDVLARYYRLAEKHADYIVRITSDCPMIPPFVISKHITTAIANKLDYISNADERCRTSQDGWDCEVFSKRFLRYAHEYAKDPYDREHVTPFMRRTDAPWIKKGMIINFLDLSQMKISIDTEEDLIRVRDEMQKVTQAMTQAEALYGRKNVHRF